MIFGTGFDVLDMPIGRVVHGSDGRTLADVWDGSPRAHLGSTVPGFPNLFILLGPHRPRAQLDGLHDRIPDRLRGRRHPETLGASGVAEVRPEVAAASNAELQRRMQGTVWNTGCSSWYQDAKGNNPTLWPDWTWRFRRRTAKFNPEEYVLA